MPELPEVETIRRGLAPVLEGHAIVSVRLNRPDLRIPFPKSIKQNLVGARIERIERRAKYLLFHLDNGQVLIAHLGMSGKMLVMDKSGYALKKHDHVIVDFDHERRLVFNDARRFGLMTVCAEEELKQHSLIAHLGPEPLGNHFNGAYLEKELSKRNTTIKAALMDQKVVVGVGNIYACEALFLSKINPFEVAKNVIKQSSKVVEAIRNVLNSAIESGGSTFRDYVGSSGEMGYFQHEFQVYGRENAPCLGCGSTIKRKMQAGRSTFYCYDCQCVR